jgi:hypothetical protein
MKPRSWTRTDADGDAATLTLDAHGAALSVWRVDGRREGWTASHEAFEREWIPWLPPAFDDVRDEVREVLEAARAAAERDDDDIP